MGTLETTNNFMTFPCNLQLNRRRVKVRKPIAIVLFAFYTLTFANTGMHRKPCYRRILWRVF